MQIAKKKFTAYLAVNVSRRIFNMPSIPANYWERKMKRKNIRKTRIADVLDPPPTLV
jgi:hypothetical protein